VQRRVGDLDVRESVRRIVMFEQRGISVRGHQFSNEAAVPFDFAFAVPASGTRIAVSANRNPEPVSSNVSKRAKRFVLICHNPHMTPERIPMMLRYLQAFASPRR
jgi:hypothetical protein